MRLLWVKSGGLVPPDTGGKIRSLNLLRELARRHDVSLFTFYGAQSDDTHQELEQFLSKVYCVPIGLPAKRGAGEAFGYARNLLSLQPYSVAKYCKPSVAKGLLEVLRREKFDAIICDFLFSSGVIPWDWPCPKILFTHNVEEQIWRRHFAVTRNLVWKAVCWREYKTLSFAERRYLGLADHVLTVSDKDLEYFSAYVPREKMTVIPTGVDTGYFQPAIGSSDSHTMVFTGSMDWMPNEDAIFYFAERILPLIRKELPQAQLRVVGRRPSDRLQSLARESSGLVVTGEVPDIRPHVLDSSVYVVPLRIGGGTRIKIFEAMAMGKAVVSTRIGAEGLPVTDGENIVLADEPQDFADAILRLFRDEPARDQTGAAARKLVEEHYSWRTVVRVFDEVLERIAQTTRYPSAQQTPAPKPRCDAPVNS
ncbi:MAG TPA: glycosyltransferase family 4 protein [Candidatus Acidoferrum sp.]|nr:glycosyltransferase family 4 protein [Candidatus Acidoferrum sp.]